jgi:SAM-dependent methyltransferase/methyltransferase-like protein
MVGTLFGMTPAPVERARVLELGCGCGNNIIPLAEMYPESTFLGIDLSPRQIADGRAACEPLNLKNIRLEQGDILELGPELGTFDYIIAHGVFSWVPPVVQEKLLKLCGELLAPQGIAIVTYNTNPGWRLRGVARDAMLFRTRGIANLNTRLGDAISVLEFLARSVPPQIADYASFWKSETEFLKSRPPSYVLHDHLELENHPIYFHEFMKRAAVSGLQYLGDAETSSMSMDFLPADFPQGIRSITSDFIETEQYKDFATCRMFRHTLLCREGVALHRQPTAALFRPMWVASRGKPEGKIDPAAGRPATFRWPKFAMNTTDRLTIETQLLLSQRWPRSMPVAELFDWARSRTGGSGATADRQAGAEAALFSLLLRGFFAGQVEFFTVPDEFVTNISDRPIAATHSRLSARRAPRGPAMVVNRRHENIKLGELQRCLLPLLDGERDLAAIVTGLAQYVRSGDLTVQEGGKPLKDEGRLEQALREVIPQALARFVENMLLIG